ncbi:MAG: DUF4912 domain-containing protein [Blastocatellia bacterium]|nr:DUF4912 domain-containing protein [Blastocatellia bacterium]
MSVSRPSSPSETAALDGSRSPVGVDSEKLSEAEMEAPFIDPGLPIPDKYDVDMVRAMIQDPFRLYVYWEVRDRPGESLARYFSPEDVMAFQLALRLIDLDEHREAFFEAERCGNRWVTVFPDRRYEFEIGVRSPVHGYIALVHSNRLRTPRSTISTEAPIEDEYKPGAAEFAEVMKASGFSEQMEDSLHPLRPAPFSSLQGMENPVCPSSAEMIRDRRVL